MGRIGQKLRAVGYRQAARLHNSQIRFMDQGRSVEQGDRLVLPKPRMRELTKLLVEQREQVGPARIFLIHAASALSPPGRTNHHSPPNANVCPETDAGYVYSCDRGQALPVLGRRNQMT